MDCHYSKSPLSELENFLKLLNLSLSMDYELFEKHLVSNFIFLAIKSINDTRVYIYVSELPTSSTCNAFPLRTLKQSARLSLSSKSWHERDSGTINLTKVQQSYQIVYKIRPSHHRDNGQNKIVEILSTTSIIKFS